MKRILPILILASITGFFGSAQTISLTGYGGYTFQERLNYGNAYGYLNESGHWGVSLEGINGRGDGIELLYQQQPTHVPVYYLALPNTQVNAGKDKTVMSYLMLNAMHHFMMGPVEPYGGIGIGAGFINNKSYSNETRFAWDAKLGLNFKVSPAVGIKVQAQLFSIIQAAGGSFYVGQDGSVTSVTSYSSIYQFGFSAGLCFNFENAD
ncbi:MAG TPA: P44/Msp2 family outer membrane protein [Puia sp.]|nr:P44/Msp2 family outer membrane protein [Puia sp.]